MALADPTQDASPDAGRDPWWFPLYEFVVHVFIGTGIFVVTAIPAVALNFLVQWLTRFGVDHEITLGLLGLEYFLFGADILLVIVFIVSSMVKAGRKLWAHALH